METRSNHILVGAGWAGLVGIFVGFLGGSTARTPEIFLYPIVVQSQ